MIDSYNRDKNKKRAKNDRFVIQIYLDTTIERIDYETPTFIDVRSIFTAANTVEHNIWIITIRCYFSAKTACSRNLSGVIASDRARCGLCNNLLFYCAKIKTKENREKKERVMKGLREIIIKLKKFEGEKLTSFRNPLTIGEISLIAKLLGHYWTGDFRQFKFHNV